jgi:hypothetical protein
MLRQDKLKDGRSVVWHKERLGVLRLGRGGAVGASVSVANDLSDNTLFLRKYRRGLPRFMATVRTSVPAAFGVEDRCYLPEFGSTCLVLTIHLVGGLIELSEHRDL